MSNTEYLRDGSRRLGIKALKCEDCGFVTSLASRRICPQCRGSRLVPQALDGPGRVLTLTTVHYPPDEFKGLAPYDIVLAAMEPGARVVAPAIRSQGRRVEMGSLVEPTLRRIKTSSEDGLIHYGVKFRQVREDV